MNVTSEFKNVDMSKYLGVFTATVNAVSKKVGGQCTVHVAAGNCWINPDTIAVADVTSIKLIAGMQFDLNVDGNLSVISDATNATVQIIPFKG